MGEKLAIAEKKVLVELVKLAQKRGLKGNKGSWKEFLDTHDRKLAYSLSDPSKRTIQILVSFLRTFDSEQWMIFDRFLQSQSNRQLVDQFRKESPDSESPEQRLVRLTVEHPLYPLDYTFPSLEGLPEKSEVLRSNEMLAVDCEMVLCEDGTEDIQKHIKKLLSHGAILVGHGLNNDLQALKLEHARVIDTSYIFKFHNAPPHRRPSLSNLSKSVLGYEVREQGAAHDCLDDACAAMKLVLSQLKHGDGILLVHQDVPKAETAKLLLHRIPINIPSEELYRIIPQNVKIEVKVTISNLYLVFLLQFPLH
ncbi:hypothetical protein SLEP1_g8236 [Rubroshorea leprosula]|uniref:Exonuclease domain-containing protein n=1 Tax=Rubroshorea leprosula TaxID=152421 RepID=A0AAV5IAW2_9ROSI|nr:hypothetical protein SLEP1_g8236 [Rubroshorea leprosula]